jgi:hypothetical protein
MSTSQHPPLVSAQSVILSQRPSASAAASQNIGFRFYIGLFLSVVFLPLYASFTWTEPVQAKSAEAASAEAELTQAKPQPTSLTRRVTFRAPNRGAPRRSAGGASRGGCNEEALLQDKGRLAAIAPLIPLVPESGIGLTAAEKPSFFVYVPTGQVNALFFSLRDDAGNTYYQTKLKAPPQGGIVRLTLPSDAPTLVVGQDYKWSVVMACGGRMRPDSPTVEAWVQRVPTSLNPALSPAGQGTPLLPLDQAIASGEAGLWYDTLEHLQRLESLAPQLARENWARVMQAAKLEVAANAEFVTP